MFMSSNGFNTETMVAMDKKPSNLIPDCHVVECLMEEHYEDRSCVQWEDEVQDLCVWASLAG